MPSENVTVRVIFKDASKYRVTVRKPEHGTAAIKGAYTYSKEYLDLYPGTDTDVYLYPEDGYVLGIHTAGGQKQRSNAGSAIRAATTPAALICRLMTASCSSNTVLRSTTIS